MRYALDRRRERGLALGWFLASTAAAVGAALVARSLMRTGWRLTVGEDPPDNPARPDVGWRDALAWGVAIGAIAGVARVVGRRGITSGWRRLRGEDPPWS
jgi:hypothetical protein